jgi:hypothetical protein
MLSTPLILFESPFSRIIGLYVPRFQVHGPADFPRIMETIILSCGIELLIIAAIWWSVRDRAKPFLVTGGFIVVEALSMMFGSNVAVLRKLDVVIGHTPGPLIWIAGFAIGDELGRMECGEAAGGGGRGGAGSVSYASRASASRFINLETDTSR